MEHYYYTVFETNKGAVAINEHHPQRRRKYVYSVSWKLSDTSYRPVFPGRTFKSAEEAIKAVNDLPMP